MSVMQMQGAHRVYAFRTLLLNVVELYSLMPNFDPEWTMWCLKIENSIYGKKPLSIPNPGQVSSIGVSVVALNSIHDACIYATFQYPHNYDCGVLLWCIPGIHHGILHEAPPPPPHCSKGFKIILYVVPLYLPGILIPGGYFSKPQHAKLVQKSMLSKLAKV